MSDTARYNHPSYGLIQFNKVNGDSPCFMSDVKLGGYIDLRVRRAEVNRSLSRYSLYPRQELIRLRMSYHQFAELITNMNSGVGIPCTLEYVNGEGRVDRYESPPDEKTQFETELKETLEDALKYLKQLKAQLQELKSKGKASRKELEDLSRLTEGMATELFSNIPFVEESFAEALDNHVAQAKVEASAWIENKLISMGLEQLKEQIKMLEGDNDR